MTAVREDGNQTFWFAPDLLPDFEPSMFRIEHWRERGAALTGRSGGRGTVWFIRDSGRALVLRHYLRGGLIARFNRDRYLRVPVRRSRAMHEFRILRALVDRGLPVPRPGAARMVRGRVFYRADLLLEMIPESRSLLEVLRDAPIRGDGWERIGRVLADFHRAGLDHADLNGHNILLDPDEGIWVIDFDQCRFRPPGSWRGRNLRRLLRSLNKEQGRTPSLHWDPSDWESLLVGYRGGN